LPLEPVEPLEESPAVGPEGDEDEAPLEAEGLLALALGELVLEPDEPLTPKAASVCRSS